MAEQIDNDSMKFIDIGANLLDPVFRGIYRGKQKHADDFHHILRRAHESGVTKIMVTCGTLAEAKEGVEFTAAHPKAQPSLYSTVGIHPTRMLAFEKEKGGPECLTEKLLQIAKGGNVVAIGECGLDYDRVQFCPKDVQLKHFEQHFRLTEETGLPMFLHNRSCGMDLVNLLRENRSRFKTGVVHSFTGTKQELDAFLELGLYIGINGCSLKTQENLDAMAEIPIDRLMLETDAPWCDVRRTHAGFSHVKSTWDTVKKPEKWTEGQCVKNRQEPCHIRQVLEVIAGHRDLDPVVVANQVFQNTMDVFFPTLN
eukprot:207483_1